MIGRLEDCRLKVGRLKPEARGLKPEARLQAAGYRLRDTGYRMRAAGALIFNLATFNLETLKR